MSSSTINKNINNNEDFEKKFIHLLELKGLMKKFILERQRIPICIIDDIKDIQRELKKTQVIRQESGREITKEELDEFEKAYQYKNSDEIKKKIKKSYRHHEKYIGETKFKEKKVLSLQGEEKGCDLISGFHQLMLEKGKGICFTYAVHLENWVWLDKQHVEGQFKLFKNNNKVICQKCNNKTEEFNGKKWYSLVIQDSDLERNPPICIGSFKVFGFLCSGFIYWFQNEQNRDAMFNWIQK